MTPTTLPAVALVIVALTGCGVPRSKYDEVVRQRDELLTTVQHQTEALEKANQSMDKANIAMRAANNSLHRASAELDKCVGVLEKVDRQNRETLNILMGGER